MAIWSLTDYTGNTLKLWVEYVHTYLQTNWPTSGLYPDHS